MRCRVVYIRLIAKPEEAVRGDKSKREEQRRRALWRVCAVLVRIYKQDKQQRILDERAKQREGKVCAHTRNVDRLTPKGGVTYDETRRRGERIKQDEVYKTNRWPRRDKHGPTLVRMLQHAWGITWPFDCMQVYVGTRPTTTPTPQYLYFPPHRPLP